MTDITAVADGYLRALATLDPEAAEAAGRTPQWRLADLSPDGFDARAELARATATAVAAATVTVPAERALAGALADRLASEVALHEAGFTTRLLAPLATPVHLARQVFDNLPRTTVDDWAVVAEHLHRLPTTLDQYAATLRRSAGRGQLVARRQVLTVADQCAAWVDADFFGDLVAGHRSEPLAGRLAEGARRATAATAKFATFLRTDLAPPPPRSTAWAATSTRSPPAPSSAPPSTWTSCTRTAGRNCPAPPPNCGRRRPTGHPDVAAARTALDADPDGRVPVGPALEEWLTRRTALTTDLLDGTHFDIPAATRRVVCRISPTTSGVMYYTPPDARLTRPAGIWWSVPPGESTVPVWRHVGTLCHEGLPGHHLQHAITLTTADLHPWQRTLCQVHGYAEGWAHYAERLADELGLYAGPAERLGMLDGQMWRAARVVIDLGLHLDLPIPAGNGFTDASRWSHPMAVDLLTRVAGLDAATARFEVDRYLGWPAQALAFKVGARLWQQTRQDAERRAGAAFDRKRFHHTALALGPMGLDPLRDRLAETFRPAADSLDRK
ncbi:DUF885 domain-containing protein [Verrucosispora sp. CWR15]|uniref:DUF885 domain-containing protein n=1 Tax=Verrucosispora sioxanthis TaxID=2499994 RepID=A0A6M1L5W8_9ACTN|nr:DUF885 domain-containing protein [Verrucosispora sioxanthis]NEE64154.1 DUF885 domain-containing protein [Verrucosispora sioxanthis]NGM13264.1 DUF885 domain-containing protein [Verrucosispora sioxanthis]